MYNFRRYYLDERYLFIYYLLGILITNIPTKIIRKYNSNTTHKDVVHSAELMITFISLVRLVAVSISCPHPDEMPIIYITLNCSFQISHVQTNNVLRFYQRTKM